jgi:hypothetical protein
VFEDFSERLGLFYGLKLLYSCFWQLIHGAHAAGADIDGPHRSIHIHMTTLYIQYKATACTALREAYIITMHGLALTYITTTCHFI